MKCSCYFIIFLFFTISLQAQPSTEDIAVKKAAALISLCEKLRYSNPDSLILTANELATVGQQQKNKDWQTNAAFFMAVYYNGKGNADTALQIAQKNIRIIKEA